MADDNQTTYVAYLMAPARSQQGAMLFSQQILAQQAKRVQEFISLKPNGKFLKTFIESCEHQRSRHRWPVLEEAVSFCLENRATLVIAEIRNFTSNDAFAKQILRLLGKQLERNDIVFGDYQGDIYCCDQPFITKESFSALAEYAKQQKKIHGELIKAGLNRTTAKSGNPHASDVITKVNKPKIDNAIVYALMLQPIISEYTARGYSQRKMVSALNEEGFTAPEGGHWVLSQLQKVIERIRMNEAALTLEKRFLEYLARHYDNATIADMLNSLDIFCPKGKIWDEELVEKVSERIKQIHDIIRFNEFIVELMPVLEKYHIDELTADGLMNEIQMAGISLPRRSIHVKSNDKFDDLDKEALLNQVVANLISAQLCNSIFTKNPKYLPYCEAQKQSLASSGPAAISKQLEALGPIANTFLTPSYNVENTKQSRRKL